MNNLIRNEILSYLKCALWAVVITIVILFFIKPTLVKGTSMYPNLKPNDFLIISKISYINKIPNRGDKQLQISHKKL